MDGNEQPMIRLAGVGKTYPDGTVAVQSLDLDVPAGALVAWWARPDVASRRPSRW
jgi:hypothetical protein